MRLIKVFMICGYVRMSWIEVEQLLNEFAFYFSLQKLLSVGDFLSSPMDEQSI